MFRLFVPHGFNSFNNKTIKIFRYFTLKNQLKLFVQRQISTSSSCSVNKQAINVNAPFEPFRSIVDENQIYRSPHEDVEIHPGYVHQYIWKDVHFWWNHTALICTQTGRSYTYKQLKQLCGKFATSLRELRLERGSTLAIVLPNLPEYAIAVLGASEAGIRVTLINPAYTANEISKQLENSEADAVITNDAKYSVVMESLKLAKIPSKSPIIVITDTTDVPNGSINFWDLVSDKVGEFRRMGGRTMINPESDTSVLPYSSGTTGLPKGVELTHRNIVANLCQYSHPDYNMMEGANDGYQDIIPLFLPIYHIYGLVICLFASLSTGAKLVCMPQFTSNNLLDVLEKHRVTLFYAVPPILQLMTYDERFKKHHLENTRSLGCGAAPVTSEVVAHFQAKMGSNFEIHQGYGLSETSPLVTTGKVADLRSVGFIVPNTQVRIVDSETDSRKNLEFFKSGEILVRGPQVMKGYYKNIKATKECMDGEWLKTGDIGHFDDKGQLFITGRMKELIKVQGCQVSPTELENIIQSHEKIADAAVVGVPHEKFGEIPKAFVILKKGASVSEQEIKEYVAQRVVKYKKLGHVVITDNIPKSPAGKILRRELQKL